MTDVLPTYRKPNGDIGPGPHVVFVYGTLKANQPNHHRISSNGGKSLGMGRVKGLLFHLGGFPALYEAPYLETWVVGELWEGGAEMLRDLDVLEGTSSGLYERRWLSVERQDVDTKTFKFDYRFRAWSYVQTRTQCDGHHRIIPSGFWSGIASGTLEWKGFEDWAKKNSTLYLPQTYHPPKKPDKPKIQVGPETEELV